MEKDLQISPRFNPHIESKKPPIMQLPANEIPSFRVQMAFEKGVARKYLINTWGGLGDQICAEPAIRYGLKVFKNIEMNLSSNCPSLYSHLKFNKVYDTRTEKVDWENYLVFNTILPPSSLLWEFCTHMMSHCVDFPSICMWRSQMPIADREIIMPDFEMTEQVKLALGINDGLEDYTVIVHAGKHWQSKTFPQTYWIKQVNELINKGFKVVLIGQKVDENVGYVSMSGFGCIDLRDKLTIPEFICLLKNCKYLLSNDSSPIHAASSGDAFIGVIATCKHPDYILHWRHGEFMWNAKNFGRDGIWNHIDFAPAQEQEVTAENIGEELLLACLPDPKEVAEYYANKRDSKCN